MKIVKFKYPNGIEVLGTVKRGFRIEAGHGGQIEADNILIRILVEHLKSQGKIIKTETFFDREEITLEHELDNSQKVKQNRIPTSSPPEGSIEPPIIPAPPPPPRY